MAGQSDGSEGLVVIFGILGVFCCIMVGFAIGYCSATVKMENQAVRNGHAEWVVNEKNEVRFKWKGDE